MRSRLVVFIVAGSFMASAATSAPVLSLGRGDAPDARPPRAMSGIEWLEPVAFIVEPPPSDAGSGGEQRWVWRGEWNEPVIAYARSVGKPAPRLQPAGRASAMPD